MSTTTPDAQINIPTSLAYWDSTPATVSGMLGGYPQTSLIDLRSSLTFLRNLLRTSGSSRTLPLSRGVDCGAGIGRVTAGFLSKACKVVDIVEPIEKFARVAEGLREKDLAGEGSVGEVFVKGLQDWEPKTKYYDLVWNQWCLGHLTDAQLVGYLKRCGESVTEEGWVVVKENVVSNEKGGDLFDDEDSSVTRSERSFMRLFAEAGLKVVKCEAQKGFPKELFPVKFWALRPVR